MSDQSLNLLIRAGNPLISIECSDERTAKRVIYREAIALSRPLFDWSVTRGMTCTDDKYKLGNATPPKNDMEEVRNALNFVGSFRDQALFLMSDLGPFMKDPWVSRRLRDLILQLDANQSNLILLDQNSVPDSIRQVTVPFEIALPDSDEIRELVRETFNRIRQRSFVEIESDLTQSSFDQMISVLRGLNRWEIERIISGAIHDDFKLDQEDISRIVDAKKRLLSSIGCLEPIDTDFKPDEIGGLQTLKEWLKVRRNGFTIRAKQFGLEAPRGVMLLGVQGCGKSLCAKVVAADWGLPLLRLDPGLLYQKFVGESESQLRQALKQAEAMAPVVVWIDEIEKAFASASAFSADGGLSKRMFGTLLAWMQDHRHPIFLVATANDVSALPPELLRKGRFDEVFFVDLPDTQSRVHILETHLKRRKIDPSQCDLQAVAEQTDGFSGSELEQLVLSAMFEAFSNQHKLNSHYLISEIPKTRPLSIIAKEKIDDLREWAKNRCVNAH